uniref:Uncharacterized protein n=1 Tax=Arundo donax TaxID=35708 RepID=A0A0A9E5J2_ARUDO
MYKALSVLYITENTERSIVKTTLAIQLRISSRNTLCCTVADNILHSSSSCVISSKLSLDSSFLTTSSLLPRDNPVFAYNSSFWASDSLTTSSTLSPSSLTF